MTALIATCHKTVSPTTHVRRERMDRRASVVSGQARPTTAKVHCDGTLAIISVGTLQVVCALCAKSYRHRYC